MEWGYLRENRRKADKHNLDYPDTLKTGLDDYLEVIFPDVKDWVNNKQLEDVKNETGRSIRPDYYSPKLRMVIEVDDPIHYNDPVIIYCDSEKDDLYTKFGYKVIRIPFFIQLTNQVVLKLFGVKVEEPLFDSSKGSMSVYWPKSIPKNLTEEVLRRIARELLRFPDQLKANMDKLKADAESEPPRKRKAKTIYTKLKFAIEEELRNRTL